MNDYSVGTTELQQLHNAAHITTILSMVEYSESVLVIIALMAMLLQELYTFAVANQ